MKAAVAAFNQEKALVGAFSVITNLRMELFVALCSLCNLILDAIYMQILANYCESLTLAVAHDMVSKYYGCFFKTSKQHYQIDESLAI